jgi:hypothetical protein
MLVSAKNKVLKKLLVLILGMSVYEQIASKTRNRRLKATLNDKKLDEQTEEEDEEEDDRTQVRFRVKI